MSKVLPKLVTAFGFVRVDVFLPDGKQLRKKHLYFIDSPSLADSLLLQMAEAQQRALTLASEMAKITGTAYMDIRCSISREARPILDRVIVATGSAISLQADIYKPFAVILLTLIIRSDALIDNAVLQINISCVGP